GRSDADHRSREPLLSSIAGFVLLGALLYLLQLTYDTGPLTAALGRTQQAVERLDELLERSKPGADHPASPTEVKDALADMKFHELVNPFRPEDEARRQSLPDATRLDVAVEEAKTAWEDLQREFYREAAAARTVSANGREKLDEMKDALVVLQTVGT